MNEKVKNLAKNQYRSAGQEREKSSIISGRNAEISGESTVLYSSVALSPKDSAVLHSVIPLSFSGSSVTGSKIALSFGDIVVEGYFLKFSCF